jgi:hypothetical protein
VSGLSLVMLPEDEKGGDGNQMGVICFRGGEGWGGSSSGSAGEQPVARCCSLLVVVASCRATWGRQSKEVARPSGQLGRRPAGLR